MRNRTDSHGRGLGADRIEQIYENWLSEAGIRQSRWRFTKRWLRLTRPSNVKRTDGTYMPATLENLATTLLRSGSWPSGIKVLVTDLYGEREETISDYMLNGDPEFTPSAIKAESEWPSIAPYVAPQSKQSKRGN